MENPLLGQFLKKNFHTDYRINNEDKSESELINELKKIIDREKY